MGMEGEEEKEKEMLVHCPKKKKKVSKISYEEQKYLCPQLMNCGTTLHLALRTLLFTYHNSFYEIERDGTSQHTLHLQEFTAIGIKGWRGRESK